MSYVKNSHIEKLVAHSYGQGGTVALPTATNNGHESTLSDFPAGVIDVLYRLIDQYSEWSANSKAINDIEWCFLVGGPGNGKSEALRSLAGAIQVELPPKVNGHPAPRSLPENWPTSAAPLVPGLEIVFINDASIPRPDALDINQLGSLSLDLSDGLSRLLNHEIPVVLFGNINRGILIEEKAAFEQISPDVQATPLIKIVSDIIEWLLTPPDNIDSVATSLLKTVVAIDPTKPYYGQLKLETTRLGAESNIVIHVVFLDALSLLEPIPDVRSPTEKWRSIDFSDNPPRLADYQTFGGFSDMGASRDSTIAGDLFTKLVNKNNWENGGCINPADGNLCEAFTKCPLAQNAKWLRNPELQRYFLDTLRAAEITAVQRFTYRDLWGHVALAILGHLEPSWLQGVHPCQWIEERVRNIKDGASADTIAELINHRIYTNIFPSPDVKVWNKYKESARKNTIYGPAIHSMINSSETTHVKAFSAAFNDIDPARDVEPWNGVREKVLSTIESLILDVSFRDLVDNGILNEDTQCEIEWDLNHSLAQEIIEELGEGSRVGLKRAGLLLKWRNTLLLRQVGLATGQIAFKQALTAWLAEQNAALRRRDSLQLGTGIEGLILPNTNNQLLVAPFRPRTYNLPSHELPPNTVLVAVDLGNLRIDIVPKGDMLVAEILKVHRKQQPQVVASLVIDLPIAREALLHVSNGTFSFTEIGSSAFARIERVRSSLIGRNSLKSSTTYFTDEVGNLYRLTDNPVGPAHLRVVAENR